VEYQDFLKGKQFSMVDAGFDGSDMWVPEKIKPFQRDCVDFACIRGRSALFADTGLGKTIMQLSWAHRVAEFTNKPVLVLAPLCVAQQTVREGKKFGIESIYIREPKEVKEKIIVTNYEMLKNFSPENFSGIVLDESSILKGMNGKIRKAITDFAKTIPYRLSCTATPSPNDFMELGSQSEFLGIMSQTEMLATFFIHDGSDTSKWRLKGHSRKKFWEWLATWAIVIRSPADLGYEDQGYTLPKLHIIEHVIETDATNGLFVDVAQGLQERNKARRDSVDLRAEKAAEIMGDWDCGIAWCNLNDESELITSFVDDCVEVTGSMSPDEKETALTGFGDGQIKKLSTKPKIAGFGLNWQHCNKMLFLGLSDSWEAFYQAVRRCYRFGQEKEVFVHVIISDREGAVLSNIKRKKEQDEQMRNEMQNIMGDLVRANIKKSTIEKAEYNPVVAMKMPKFLGA
jgi:hypothetical protein